MTLLWAVFVVIAFAGIVHWTRVPGHAGEAARRARDSYVVVADRSLSDEEKERRLRAEAPRLFRLLGRIVLGGVLALGLPIGAVRVLEMPGWASFTDVLDMLQRVDFLVAVTVVGTLVLWAVKRWGSRAEHGR